MTRPTKRKQQLRASAKELNVLKSRRELRKRPKVVRKRAKKRIPAVATRVVKKRLPPSKATTEALKKSRAKKKLLLAKRMLNLQKGVLYQVSQLSIVLKFCF